MARATAADVRAIMDYDPVIKNIQPFIDAANELVTEICAVAANGYTDDRLKMIETWLAAHFLAVRDPRYASESMGGASASYQSQVGLNLSLTPYGQQAQLLDSKGGLARLDKHVSQGKRAVARVTHLGQPDDKRNAYADYPWRYYTLGNYW